MTVSYENSRAVFDGIKAAGINSISALPETWLGLLLQRAEDDPDVELIQVYEGCGNDRAPLPGHLTQN